MLVGGPTFDGGRRRLGVPVVVLDADSLISPPCPAVELSISNPMPLHEDVSRNTMEALLSHGVEESVAFYFINI